ncbi:MAG TPA: sugar transferase [Chloroflexota bacterium]|nr:sugar transferase [Chloroflexota bacterium]
MSAAATESARKLTGGRGLPRLGPAAPVASQHPAEPVRLAGLPPARTVEMAERLLSRGVPVEIDVGGSPTLRRALGSTGAGSVVLRPAATSPIETVVTRIRDVVVAGATLLLVAPLLGGLALLVKRSSPGPALFSTRVVGRGGRVFVWRKLRTMRVGRPADDAARRERYRAFLEGRAPQAGSGVGAKIVDTARITPLGRVLRRHSLDELPQLWNVLVGDMTLVGPRPCLTYEYELQAPWQRLRYRVKPGLTGPWQAYGRSQLSFDEMALLDYCYGRTKTPWTDLRILLRTVRVLVTGEGGY